MSDEANPAHPAILQPNLIAANEMKPTAIKVYELEDAVVFQPHMIAPYKICIIPPWAIPVPNVF